MDAATVRSRLRAEGISVTAHRDGTLTASLMKPREQAWTLFLRHRVKPIPGAVVWLSKERPAADPYFAHNEVRFSLGTRPEFINSVHAKQLETEGPNHEVEKAEGAVTPARTCVSPGRRPGSVEGPGRVSRGGERSAA